MMGGGGGRKRSDSKIWHPHQQTQFTEFQMIFLLFCERLGGGVIPSSKLQVIVRA